MVDGMYNSNLYKSISFPLLPAASNSPSGAWCLASIEAVRQWSSEVGVPPFALPHHKMVSLCKVVAWLPYRPPTFRWVLEGFESRWNRSPWAESPLYPLANALSVRKEPTIDHTLRRNLLSIFRQVNGIKSYTWGEQGMARCTRRGHKVIQLGFHCSARNKPLLFFAFLKLDKDFIFWHFVTWGWARTPQREKQTFRVEQVFVELLKSHHPC